MTDRVYVEEITDPVTGEVTTFRAATEAELDRLVQERFGIDREDRESPIRRSLSRRPRGMVGDNPGAAPRVTRSHKTHRLRPNPSSLTHPWAGRAGRLRRRPTDEPTPPSPTRIRQGLSGG